MCERLNNNDKSLGAGTTFACSGAAGGQACLRFASFGAQLCLFEEKAELATVHHLAVYPFLNLDYRCVNEYQLGGKDPLAPPYNDISQKQVTAAWAHLTWPVPLILLGGCVKRPFTAQVPLTSMGCQQIIVGKIVAFLPDPPKGDLCGAAETTELSQSPNSHTAAGS